MRCFIVGTCLTLMIILSGSAGICVPSSDPQPLMTIHGPIDTQESLTLRVQKKHRSLPHPTLKQVGTFNTISGAVLSGVQLFWMIKNWQLRSIKMAPAVIPR